MADEHGLRSPEYRVWLNARKSRVRQVQLKAAVSVNQELLRFYWELGADIVAKQEETAWGSGFLKQLSLDLTAAREVAAGDFPNYSPNNRTDPSNKLRPSLFIACGASM